MLSLYYVLVINFKYTDATQKKWVEPSMHAVAGIWAFGTAIYSASSGLLNNANLWCWIAPLPLDCLDSWRYGDGGNCIRGDNAWIYRWAFYFAPLNIILFKLFLNFLHVSLFCVPHSCLHIYGAPLRLSTGY
jgi:hypothetical protein